MTGEFYRPTRILVVAHGPHGEAALRTALAMARRHGAKLEVMGCVEPPADLRAISKLSGKPAEVIIDGMRDRLRAQLEMRLASCAPDAGASIHIGVGKAFMEIIARAVRTRCDLVVKHAEPLGGLGRFFFTSTDQHLLRKCPCPVWLHPPEGATAPRRVIAAVDVNTWDAAEPETLRALNREVIAVARAIAAPDGGEVIALHAWEAAGEGALWAFAASDDSRQAADAYVAEVRHGRDRALQELTAPYQEDGEPCGPAVTPRLVRGTPEHVLENETRTLGAQCVVIGTVARTGLGGVIIGNTAENIINSLTHPLVAVKPDGFVTPLKLT